MLSDPGDTVKTSEALLSLTCAIYHASVWFGCCEKIPEVSACRTFNVNPTPPGCADYRGLHKVYVRLEIVARGAYRV